MSWYILRHAEKEWGGYYNPKLRHQDEPISQRGREQAESLVAYFADKEISRIYVSAYIRTGQTIAPVARTLNLEPVLDERLNEIDNGLFEGASEGELRQKFPAELQALRERLVSASLKGRPAKKPLNGSATSWKRSDICMRTRTSSSWPTMD